MKFQKKIVLLFLFFAVIISITTINYQIDPFNLTTQLNNDKEVLSETKYLIPGGQTIGVELKTRGVLVVGLADLISNQKVSVSPAKKSGLKIGDKILKIDHLDIESINDILHYTEKNKVKSYSFLIERNSKKITLNIEPIVSFTDEVKFGFWARDNIAGIGTLTFINPETKTYGAIGHGITDADTGELIDINTGIISKAEVTNIKLGKKGTPGEIIGYILKNDGFLGTVKENTIFGIKGEVNESSDNFFNDKIMEIGHKEDIYLGKASIYADVNGKVKEYEIEIVKLFKQNNPTSKSMIIKIIDENLLNITNGIIQGMSGCPIIQNNKIIGAVTHVFLSDPSKGYGIYLDWLLN